MLRQIFDFLIIPCWSAGCRTGDADKLKFHMINPVLQHGTIISQCTVSRSRLLDGPNRSRKILHRPYGFSDASQECQQPLTIQWHSRRGELVQIHPFCNMSSIQNCGWYDSNEKCTHVALIAFSPLLIQGYRRKRAEPNRGRRAGSGGEAHIDRPTANTKTMAIKQSKKKPPSLSMSSHVVFKFVGTFIISLAKGTNDHDARHEGFFVKQKGSAKQAALMRWGIQKLPLRRRRLSRSICTSSEIELRVTHGEADGWE